MVAPFQHDAVLYGSDDEYFAVVVPFLREGLEAGVPTLLRTEEHRAQRVSAALGDPPGLTVVEPLGAEHPFTVLQTDHDVYDRHLATGVPWVHVVSDPPVAPVGWSGWARYEAVRNHVHRDRAVRLLCPYATGAGREMLDDVGRTHPWLRDGAGTRTESTHYADPADFLDERARAERDPLEDAAPALDLTDPTPAQGRHALTRLGAPESLVYAASEVLTNAVQHGAPPVRLRAWAAPDRVVVTVHDNGPGPADPFVGLLPTGRRLLQAGMGLWMAYRMCDRMGLERGPADCTVRLTSYA